MLMMVAHADWSMHPAKRWAVLARRGVDGWRMEAPRPVGDPAQLARELLAPGEPAALGLDVPLGLPRGFARHRAEADFPAFLAARTADARFFTVHDDLAEVTPQAPFYPRRPVKGVSRAAHAAALGLAGPAALNRWCDAATALRPAGAPVFWTLGANQSGKAAIAAWRDWLAPALASGAPFDLWPFAGPLASLLRPGRLALAEVYPAEALRQLGLRLPGSKRATDARRALAGPLRAAMRRLRAIPTPEMLAGIETGFGTDAAGEDRLDCTLGALNMIAVIEGARADTIPDDPWVRRWEGWVLGQAELPRQPPAF